MPNKATALLLALGLAAASAQETIRPAKPGDVHVYGTQQKMDRKSFEETVTITAVEGAQIRTRHVRDDRSPPTEGLYGRDWSVFKSGASGSSFEPPSPMLAPPLEVGKAWEAAYLVNTANGGRSRVKMAYKVAAREKLATPAGEFDTWRIESSGYVNGVSWPGGFGVQQKAWYAPAIDRLVRIEYREQRSMGADNVIELKRFQPAD